MSKHKALELADVMDCLSAMQRSRENAADRAAAELRAQHALIVQMREALDTANTGLRWYQESSPQFVDGSDDEANAEISAALAAADQYLKGEQA